MHIKRKNISKIFKMLFLKIGITLFSFFIILIVAIELIELSEDKKTEKELILETQKKSIKSDVESVIQYLDILDHTSSLELDKELKNSMNNAIQIASEIYRELKSKNYPDHLIQENIKEAIRPLRYLDKRASIFILSSNATYEMHPIHSEWEKIKDIQSITGISKEEVDTLITKTKFSGDNFYTYQWNAKENAKNKKEFKRVYGKYFEPYNWIFIICDNTDDYKKKILHEAIGWIKKSFDDNKDMLFINNLNGEAIVIKSATLKPGDNIKQFADPNGLKIFEQEYKIATETNGDFLTYNWLEKNGQWVPKIAYIKGYPKWNWMIGSSSSRESSINDLELFEKSSIKNSLAKVLVIIVLIAFIFAAFILFIKRIDNRITNNFKRFSNLLKLSIDNNKTISNEAFDIDEIQSITNSTNKILENHNKTTKLLNDSEKRLNIIIDNAPILIQGYDKNLNVVYWNKETEKATLLTKENTIGKKSPIESIYEGKMAKIIIENMFNELNNFSLFEIPLLNGNTKHQYWASFKTSENLIIWIGYDVTDIVERKLKTKEDELFLNTILDNIPIPVFYKDTNSIYLGANKEFCKINATSKESIIGKNVFEIAPPDLAMVYKAKDDDFFKKKEIQIYESKFINLYEKKEKIYNFHKAPLFDSKGELKGLIGAMTDITEKVEYEEKIKNYQSELAISNNTKDKFFKIIARDLKTPFETFIKFTELLSGSIAKQDKAKSIAYASIMRSSSYSGFQLLSNLLEWSRSQTGTLNTNIKPNNLLPILTEIIQKYKTDLTEKNLNITHNLSADSVAIIDAHMITIVLSNLISNAIKYSNVEGSIEVNFESDNINSLITVIDYGVGIEPQNINKLFKIEESYSTLGTKGEKGTGLGLILSQEFIKKHNGDIWCESIVNNKTTFFVRIPNL